MRRLQLRCRLPPSSGGSNGSTASLRQAAIEVAGAAPELAVDLLFDALVAYIRDAVLIADMTAAIREAIALRERVDEAWRGVSTSWRVPCASPVAAVTASGYSTATRRSPAPGERWPTRCSCPRCSAPSLAYLGRTSAAESLLDELEADFRTWGALRPLIGVLGAQAVVQYGRSYPATMALALEAMSLAETNGTPEFVLVAAAALTLCAAAIGYYCLLRAGSRVARRLPPAGALGRSA